MIKENHDAWSHRKYVRYRTLPISVSGSIISSLPLRFTNPLGVCGLSFGYVIVPSRLCALNGDFQPRARRKALRLLWTPGRFLNKVCSGRPSSKLRRMKMANLGVNIREIVLQRNLNSEHNGWSLWEHQTIYEVRLGPGSLIAGWKKRRHTKHYVSIMNVLPAP